MKSRTVAIARVAFHQKLRDRLGLLLHIGTAPLFVLFYWLFFSTSTTTADILVCNMDDGPHGTALVNAFREMRSGSGTSDIAVKTVSDEGDMQRRLTSGTNGAGLIIHADFSRSLAMDNHLPQVTVIGDVSSREFQLGYALLEKGTRSYVSAVKNRPPVLTILEKPLGASGLRTTFEVFVPSLLVFAVIMLIFSSSMAVSKEVEAGTVGRLRMTPVTTFDLLAGLSAVQLLFGILSVLLTLFTAHLLGFRSHGSLLLSMGVSAAACVASVGIGMMVASISRTQARSFLISSVAMFLLVLFSGLVFPRPSVPLFHAATVTVDLFDVLPTTHMGEALRKILMLGGTLSSVVYELSALCAIALINFVVGGLLFIRTGRPSNTTWEGMP